MPSRRSCFGRPAADRRFVPRFVLLLRGNFAKLRELHLSDDAFLLRDAASTKMLAKASTLVATAAKAATVRLVGSATIICFSDKPHLSCLLLSDSWRAARASYLQSNFIVFLVPPSVIAALVDRPKSVLRYCKAREGLPEA